MSIPVDRRRFLVGSLALAGSAKAVKEVLLQGSRPPQEPSTYNPAVVKEWFDKTYFNLLMDYYPEVRVRPYGTGFTRQNLVQALRAILPGFVMTYAKGHSGTTAFKSRLGTEHPMLGEDPLAAFRAATREPPA